MRKTALDMVHELARSDGRVVFIGSDLGAGTLDVRIGARFPLAQAADAHRALEGRRTTGKVLLVP